MSSTDPPPKPSPDTNSSSQDEALPTSTTAFASAPRPLPLPEPGQNQNGEGATTKLDVSGDGTTVKLDHLGPLVVNKDGTLSRIGNWVEMNDIERKNTLRILAKRNQLRLTDLRGEADSGAKAPSHVGGGQGGGSE
ncbi:uncharacterized protein DNG_03242 [Cephalotrichum gorgonifer]|uniref:Uncharacterized protein n=1 Tax=Cephalotrichum gorgonifer TaxID=2041049 RepID=A0AAE8SU27_9PEZI|nr:uncharacterized protein DNG_03242 [Cephalotrichum gorgonifer]